jgi:hypothetical protein
LARPGFAYLPQRYVQFLEQQPGAIEAGLGDWMALETKAIRLTGLAFEAMSYLAYANISAALGLVADAQHYRQAAAAVTAAINARFLDPVTGMWSSARRGFYSRC